jgi:hypothetical protein
MTNRINRRWKKLTPKQAQDFKHNADKIAMRVLKSLVYEVRLHNGDTYIAKL